MIKDSKREVTKENRGSKDLEKKNATACYNNTISNGVNFTFRRDAKIEDFQHTNQTFNVEKE